MIDKIWLRKVKNFGMPDIFFFKFSNFQNFDFIWGRCLKIEQGSWNFYDVLSKSFINYYEHFPLLFEKKSAHPSTHFTYISHVARIRYNNHHMYEKWPPKCSFALEKIAQSPRGFAPSYATKKCEIIRSKKSSNVPGFSARIRIDKNR